MRKQKSSFPAKRSLTRDNTGGKISISETDFFPGKPGFEMTGYSLTTHYLNLTTIK